MVLAFALGSFGRAIVRSTAQAAGPLVIADGSADAGRDEMLDVLDSEYFRPIDRARLGQAEVSAWPAILGDQYTHFMSADEYQRFMTDETATTVGIGVDFDVHDGEPTLTRVFPHSPADQGGLRRGDVLVAIDGVPFHGHTPIDSTNMLKGDDGSVAHIEVRRANSLASVAVTRRVSSAWMVDAEIRHEIGHRIGYVALMDFSEGVGALTRRAVARLLDEGAEGFVLDLRGNPGGWAKEAVRVAEVFLPEESAVLVERSVHFDVTVYSTHAAPITTDVPMVVLVDGGTASSAEIVAGALHDHFRAKLVGSTTFGKGRIQDVAVLATGGALKYTVAEYLTPNGFALDHRGLMPDVESAPNRSPDGDDAYDSALAQLLR